MSAAARSARLPGGRTVLDTIGSPSVDWLKFLDAVSSGGRRAARRSGRGAYEPAQATDPTGELLPVEVAVKPKVTLPPAGMVRL